MKVCPKCRRSYGDEIDFCLRDGKPLVKADAVVSEPQGGTTKPDRDASVGSALRVKAWDRQETRSPSSSPRSGAPWAPNDAAAVTERPREKTRPGVGPWIPPREVPPPSPRGDGKASGDTIAPWVPGTVREFSVSGIRLTMPVGLGAPKPPWETAKPIPLRKVTVVPPESSASSPDPAYSEPVVLTPDLPVPPPEREDAEPVGDETILVVEADEEELDLDGLELEEIVPPPAPELPLEARYTRRAAIVRPPFMGPAPGPPVEDDEAEYLRPRLLIHTEDVFEPPDPDDEDALEPENFLVYWKGKRVTPAGEPLEPETRGRRKSWYLWVAAMGLLLAVAGVVIFQSRDDSVPRPMDGAVVPGGGTPGGARGDRHLGSRKLRPLREPVASIVRGPKGMAGAQGLSNPGGGAQAVSTPNTPPAPPAGGPGESETTPRPEPPMARVTPLPSMVAPDSAVASIPSPPASAPVSVGAGSGEVRPGPSGAEAGEPGESVVAGVSPAVDHPPQEPQARSSPPGETAVRPDSVASTPARRGTLLLHSVPEGATVYLDGKRYGTTPLSLSAALGRHRVRVERDGYAVTETVVNIDSSDAGRLSVSLDPLPEPASTPKPSFRLVVSSNAIGADVFIDGHKRGTVPLSVVLEAGSHTVKVVAADKTSQEATVSVSAPMPANHIERRYFQF